MRALYDFVYTPVATSKNSIGVGRPLDHHRLSLRLIILSYEGEGTPESYLPGDLDMFFKNFSSSQVGQRPVFKSIDGGVLLTNETGLGINTESDLDLQYAMSLVGKDQPVTLYQVGDPEQGENARALLFDDVW